MKIDGKTYYLRRSVDHDGKVSESYDTKYRDKNVALNFLKKAMRK